MNQQDIEQVAKIFDSIINSPSQAVQDAFKNLTVLAALANSDQQTHGPFERIFGRISTLEYELKELRREVQIHNNSNMGSDMFQDVSDVQLSFEDNMTNGAWIGGTGSVGNITIGDTTDTVYIDSICINPVKRSA